MRSRANSPTLRLLWSIMLCCYQKVSKRMSFWIHNSGVIELSYLHKSVPNLVISTLVPKEHCNSPVAPNLAYQMMNLEGRGMPGPVAQLQLCRGKSALSFCTCLVFIFWLPGKKITKSSPTKGFPPKTHIIIAKNWFGALLSLNFSKSPS